MTPPSILTPREEQTPTPPSGPRLVLPRWSKYALVALAIAVSIAVIYLPRLRRSVHQFGSQQKQEDQTQRGTLTQALILTATDVPVKARLFFGGQSGSLTSSDIELPLSADPVQRAKQLIAGLITDAPSASARTLPADTTLLAFYLLPDGTAIADFSDALSTGTPSGILSEQLVVQSVAQTLAAGVPQIRRLKILLHGQEADTLAGHLDLTGFFPVNVSAADTAPTAPSPGN